MLTSAQQVAEVVVQISTTIMALVYDDCIAITVILIQQLIIELAEAVAIH